MTRIVIVDYGAGNLRSVTKAVERTGHCPRVTDDPRALDHATAVIVPGVGAAADTMRNLHERGMEEPIREYIASGRPFLGVCMGMQALFTRSEEDRGQQCLDIVPGVVRRLPDGLKIPHMGWNTVRQVADHYIFDGIPDEAYFYFVHSFFAEPEDSGVVIGETDYGRPFPAVIARDNVVATQFHPEKSSDHGLRFYANFLRHALDAGSPK
jgi:glutamine amidotransferase